LIGPDADMPLNFHAHGFEIEAKLQQNVNGNALSKRDQSQQKVLGADKIMIEAGSLFSRQGYNLLSARREAVQGFKRLVVVARHRLCQCFPKRFEPIHGNAGSD
jgi:hypothetical protein